jgi:hypothetical protein
MLLNKEVCFSKHQFPARVYRKKGFKLSHPWIPIVGTKRDRLYYHFKTSVFLFLPSMMGCLLGSAPELLYYFEIPKKGLLTTLLSAASSLFLFIGLITLIILTISGSFGRYLTVRIPFYLALCISMVFFMLVYSAQSHLCTLLYNRKKISIDSTRRVLFILSCFMIFLLLTFSLSLLKLISERRLINDKQRKKDIANRGSTTTESSSCDNDYEIVSLPKSNPFTLNPDK